MKNTFWLTVLAVASMTLPAQASLVKDAELNAACDGNTPVVVHRGMGAAIDFTQTGYVVQRAWLGDPSRLTLDTDGPMEQGVTKVVYLRAIDGLSFDGLPSTSTTVLTARLAGPRGAKLCQFPVSYGSGAPDYTSLRLSDDSAPTTPPQAKPRSLLAQVNLDNVEMGISVNAATLGQASPVVQRVNQFISKVRNGQSQRSAAQELGIEWALLIELERQGAISPAAYRETVFS